MGDSYKYAKGMWSNKEFKNYAFYKPDFIHKNPEYMRLNAKDKMNFEFFMLDYDINYKKELSEGQNDIMGIRSPGDAIKVFTSAKDLPSFINRFLAMSWFLAILFIAIVVIILVLNLVFGGLFAAIFKVRMHPLKVTALKKGFLISLGFLGIMGIVVWVLNRAYTNIENITLYIK